MQPKQIADLDEITGVEGQITAITQDRDLTVWACDDLGGVYVSKPAEGKMQFEKVYQFVPKLGRQLTINSVAAGKSKNGTYVIYVATNFGLEYSIDMGKTFTQASIQEQETLYSATQVSIAPLNNVVLSIKYSQNEIAFWNIYIGNLDFDPGIFTYHTGDRLANPERSTLKFDISNISDDQLTPPIAMSLGEGLRIMHLGEGGFLRGAFTVSVEPDFSLRYPGHIVNITSDRKGNIYALWLTRPNEDKSQTVASILSINYFDYYISDDEPVYRNLRPITVIPNSFDEGCPTFANPFTNVFFTNFENNNNVRLYMGQERSRDLYWIQPNSTVRRDFNLYHSSILPYPVASAYHDITDAFATAYAVFGTNKKVVRVQII